LDEQLHIYAPFNLVEQISPASHGFDEQLASKISNI